MQVAFETTTHLRVQRSTKLEPIERLGPGFFLFALLLVAHSVFLWQTKSGDELLKAAEDAHAGQLKAQLEQRRKFGVQ